MPVRFLLFLISVYFGAMLMGSCIHGADPLPDEGKALFPIFENGKYGYIDQAGKVVIKPQFDKAKRFSEGLARVKVGSKWGFINATATMVIAPQLELDADREENDPSLDFHEGMAAVSLDNGMKWGFIDKSGKMSIAPKYGTVSRFSEGIAAVTDEGPYPPVVADTPNRSPAIRRSRYIDKAGKILSFALVGETFSEGLAVVGIREGEDLKEGYVDKTGQIQIKPQFSIARAFHEGLARVRPGNTNDYGYIDKTGKMVISLTHVPGDDGPGDFYEGLAVMQGRESGEVGFIDKTGAFAIEPKFHIAGRFSDGVAGGCVQDKTANSGEGGLACGYIDRAGQWIIKQLSFDGPMSDFHEGLAFICGKTFCGYMNKKGSFVWRTSGNLEHQVSDINGLVGCTVWNWPDPDYAKDYCHK